MRQMISFGDLKCNERSILSIPSQICQVINCLKEKDEKVHVGITLWLIRVLKTFQYFNYSINSAK